MTFVLRLYQHQEYGATLFDEIPASGIAAVDQILGEGGYIPYPGVEQITRAYLAGEAHSFRQYLIDLIAAGEDDLQYYRSVETGLTEDERITQLIRHEQRLAGYKQAYQRLYEGAIR